MAKKKAKSFEDEMPEEAIVEEMEKELEELEEKSWKQEKHKADLPPPTGKVKPEKDYLKHPKFNKFNKGKQ